MATIIKKNISGKAYYYARECQRANGKPNIVWQEYLGHTIGLPERWGSLIAHNGLAT